MSTRVSQTTSRPSSTVRARLRSLAYARTPVALFALLLILSAVRAPQLFTSSGIGGAIASAAPLVLAAMALTPIAMVGRGSVDLSIGPLISFINVGLIQWLVSHGINAPVKLIGYALAAGIICQVVMGLIIAVTRIEPVIVALAGYLVLVGLNLVIMPKPGGQAPAWLAGWGSGRSVVSPMLLLLLVAFLAWWGFTRTALYINLRLTGSDERTAYVSGIPIGLMRVLAHAIGGVFAGLAGLAFTGLIGSGDPTQGSTYTLIAVTALVLGGTSLAGGSGGAFGSVIGAVDIFLISFVLATFDLGPLSSFVVQLTYGAVLVAALMVTVFISDRSRARKAARS